MGTNTTRSISVDASVTERFWGKVVKSDEGCWSWSAATGGSQGYGVLAVESEPRYAHRVSWVVHFGEIPQGMSVLHTCDTPTCTNPRHLFLGDQRANLADARAKGRMRNGNPFKVGHTVSAETRAKIGAASRARWALRRASA